MNPIKETENFLSRFVQFTPLEWARIVPYVRVKLLEKDDHLFRQGEDCENLYMVLKGIFKVYYQNNEGEEKIKRFISRGETLAPMPSIIKGETSCFSAQALENSVVAYLKYSEMESLTHKSHHWERALRKGLEESLVAREDREYELFMLTPQERYEKFVNKYPQLMNQLPQYLIASYLGITPVSLSRIRARK